MGFFFFIVLVIGFFSVIKSIFQQRERIDGIKRSSLDSDFGRGPRDLNTLSADEAKRVRAAMARQIVKDLQKSQEAPKGSSAVLLDPKVQQLQAMADATKAARAKELSQAQKKPSTPPVQAVKTDMYGRTRPAAKPHPAPAPALQETEAPPPAIPQASDDSNSGYFAWQYEPEKVPSADYDVSGSTGSNSSGQADTAPAERNDKDSKGTADAA